MNYVKSILTTFFIGAVMVSCGSSSTVNNGRVYRTPDGTIYRQGEIYRDQNGKVYRNGSIYRNNGSVYSRNGNQKNLPPGQAKKIYGGEATDYAPGQVKKRQQGKHAKKSVKQKNKQWK